MLGKLTIYIDQCKSLSVRSKKHYKAPTNSMSKLTIRIRNAGPLRGPALLEYYVHIGRFYYIFFSSFSNCPDILLVISEE